MYEVLYRYSRITHNKIVHDLCKSSNNITARQAMMGLPRSTIDGGERHTDGLMGMSC
jgi:hypothetical protein